jgi:uncharacterized membrane protein
MFSHIFDQVKNTIKAITAILGTILGFLVALEFLQGFAANSTNISSLFAFFLVWAIFSIVTDELDSALKKLLAGIGIPGFLIALFLVLLHFMM